MVGAAPTGSEKTLSNGLPVLQMLLETMNEDDKNGNDDCTAGERADGDDVMARMWMS